MLDNCFIFVFFSRKLTMEKLRYQKRLKDAEEEYKDNFTYSDNNTELRDIIVLLKTYLVLKIVMFLPFLF